MVLEGDCIGFASKLNMFQDGWVNMSEDGDVQNNDHYCFDATTEDVTDLPFPAELEAEVDICDDLAITPKSNSGLDETLVSANKQSHHYDIAVPSAEAGIVSTCTSVSSPAMSLSTISTIDEIKPVSPRKTSRNLQRPKRGMFEMENERRPTRAKGLKIDAQNKRQKLQNRKSNERVVADYPVNALLGVRIEEGELQYLVNWTPSWEPERNINEPLLREWWLPRVGEHWSSVNLMEWVKDVNDEGIA